MFKHVIGDPRHKFTIGLGKNTENSYRRSEERVSLFYVLFISLFAMQMLTFLSFKLACTNLQNVPIFYSFKDLYIQLLNVILKTVVVIYMLYLMRLRANYTFNEKMRGIVVYYLLDTMSFAISSTNFFILSLQKNDPNLNFFQQVCLISYYLNVHSILAAYSIVYLKSSQDIINDVNKLQDVYRVS